MRCSSRLAALAALALIFGCAGSEPPPRTTASPRDHAGADRRNHSPASPGSRPRAAESPRAGTDGAARPAAGPAGVPAGSKGKTRARCKTPEPAAAGGYLAASHILIFYQGASRAPARIQRSKADARRLAARITALAQRPGADFAKLAGQWSEGPTRTRGGRLGRFQARQMVPPFSAAVVRTCIGDVTGPVETRFGFHVIRRDHP